MLSQLTAAKQAIAALLSVTLVATPVATAHETNFVATHIEQTPITKALSKYDQRQIQCLSENIYFEAGNQSEKGMIAVTNVVVNRTRDERFPDSPCKVIHQKNRGVCQFSWTCGKKKRIRDWLLFDKAKRLAEKAVRGELKDVTGGSKFYHASYVNPHWQFARVTQIGTHIFYRG